MLKQASGNGSSKLCSKQGHFRLCGNSSGWAAGTLGEGPMSWSGNLVQKVITLSQKIFFLASNWHISCCFLFPLPLVLLLCFWKKSLGEGEEKLQVTFTFSSFMVWWLYTSARAFRHRIGATNTECAVLLSRGKRNCNLLIILWGLKGGRIWVSCFHICAPMASSYHLSQQKGCRNIKYYLGIWQSLSNIWLSGLQ